jgi:sporulation protein YlmC with PRC-barrel domain
MEFKDGASVYTSNGSITGSLYRVVIDPETKKVTHIVIQKGLLVKEDKVIAMEKVASASPEKVTLNCTVDEIKEMPPLEIEKYEPMSGNSGREQNYDPLAGRMYWTERSVIMETKRTIPDELVALKEGARVMIENDEHVGNVERVFTEPETGKVTHFIVSQGLLLKTRKTVPIQWVGMLDDVTVRLSVGIQQLEALPALGEGFS